LAASAPDAEAEALKAAGQAAAAKAAALKAAAAAAAGLARARQELAGALPAGKAMAMGKLKAAQARDKAAKAAAALATAAAAQQALAQAVLASSVVAKPTDVTLEVPSGSDKALAGLNATQQVAHFTAAFASYHGASHLAKQQHQARSAPQLVVVATQLARMSPADRTSTLLQKAQAAEKRRLYVKNMLHARAARLAKRQAAVVTVAEEKAAAIHARAKAASQRLADLLGKSSEARNKKRELAMYSAGWESW
jgi:hypothetical protein